MTERQALHIVIASHSAAKESAAIVTAAHARYIVRTPSGIAAVDTVTGKVIETDDAGYAASARFSFNGTIVDRWNWRNN